MYYYGWGLPRLATYQPNLGGSEAQIIYMYIQEGNQ